MWKVGGGNRVTHTYMLSLSVTHAVVHTTQQAYSDRTGPPVFGGNSLMEQTMTINYGLQRIIEIQNDMQTTCSGVATACAKTQRTLQVGVAHVVCVCSQATSV
jgi:hypothetical protein